MNHLTPCPSCSRHVRVSESACPFCDAALELSDVPPPVLPARRLTRARLFTFSATLAAGLAAAGCSSDDDGGVVAAYGSPADAAAGGTSGAAGASGASGAAGEAGATNTGGQAGSPNTLYGLPPDAG